MYYDSAIPGIIIAILIATTVSDPAKDERYQISVSTTDDEDDKDENSKSNSSNQNGDSNEDSSVRNLNGDFSDNERSTISSALLMPVRLFCSSMTSTH